MDATVCAIDGTVNCASREEGRPALAGAAAAAAAGVIFSTGAGAATGDFDLEETVVCIGLADVLETVMGTGLATARVLEMVGETGFAVDALGLAGALGATGTLAAGFALTLATGFAVLTAAPLVTGLLWAFATGLAAGLGTTLAATFETPLATGFADAWATDLLAGLADLAAGLAATAALPLPAGALLSFPDLAFTSCLLAEISCAWSVDPAFPPRPLEGFSGGASPARECTGLPTGKPISCKIETIIWLSI